MVAISNMDFNKVLITVLALVGVLVVAIIGRYIISRYRKDLLGGQDSGGSWGLDDLREMKDSGQLSDVEYRLLREKLIRETMTATDKAKRQSNPRPDRNDNISG